MKDTEKTEFPKSIEMSWDEKKAVIKDAQERGFSTISIQSFPDNKHWIMKIVGIPKVYPAEDDPERGSVYWDVEFKYGTEKIPTKIRTSKGAYDNMLTKHPDNEFVGKYAFFTHYFVNKKHVHSVGVFSESREPADISDTLSLMEKAGKKPIENTTTLVAVDEYEIVLFVREFEKQVNEYNANQTDETKKKKLTLGLCQLQYFKTKHADEFKFIEKHFGE